MANRIGSHPKEKGVVDIVDKIRSDEDDKLKRTMKGYDAKNIDTSDFNPDMHLRIAKKSDKHHQSAYDKKLDRMRSALCAEMNVTLNDIHPWNALCGGKALDFAFGPGATTGASDIVPVCGRQAATLCARGTAAANPSGSLGIADATMNCDMTAWKAACGMGSEVLDMDPKDPGYNQALYGTLPLECYCACKNQCLMGQSNVLAQRPLRRPSSLAKK